MLFDLLLVGMAIEVVKEFDSWMGDRALLVQDVCHLMMLIMKDCLLANIICMIPVEKG